jgi:hypothetical protein
MDGILVARDEIEKSRPGLLKTLFVHFTVY